MDKESAQEIVRSLVIHVESLENTWRYQLLNNADQIAVDFERLVHKVELGEVSSGNASEQFKALVESLVKLPYKRQMGRLKGMLRSLQEVQNVLER